MTPDDRKQFFRALTSAVLAHCETTPRYGDDVIEPRIAVVSGVIDRLETQEEATARAAGHILNELRDAGFRVEVHREGVPDEHQALADACRRFLEVIDPGSSGYMPSMLVRLTSLLGQESTRAREAREHIRQLVGEHLRR